MPNRYLIDFDGSNEHSINSQHDQLVRSINQSGNIVITSKQRRSLNDENSGRPSNSYNSFRDEFSHRQILNNPFDFDESFEEEENQNENDDEPTVIILSSSR